MSTCNSFVQIPMDTVLNKELYDAPTLEVVKVKAGTAILQASKPDYDPDIW